MALKDQIRELRNRFHAFQEKHEKLFHISFFIAGFSFDLLLVTTPDETRGLIQQALYLFIVAFFMLLEVRSRIRPIAPPRGLQSVWMFRELIEHFLLGTLLNFYSIFYFKSASLINSFLFLIILVLFLIANEVPFFRRSGLILRTSLFSLCLNSYLAILFPILLGYVGKTPFALSCLATVSLIFALYWRMKKEGADQQHLMRALVQPAVAVQFIFVALYLLQILPPVPLSAKAVGIYHDVKRNNGNYLLSQEHRDWKVWLNGDQEFHARIGDRIFIFVSIYSPARFADHIRLKWLFKDPRFGWKVTDEIPLQIHGGREEGFRGFAVKTNYTPGDWRVEVESGDHREITRLYFTVYTDATTGPRELESIER